MSHNSPITRFNKSEQLINYAVSILLLVTIGIALFQLIGIERSLVFDARTTLLKSKVGDDRAFQGSSVGTLKQTDLGLEFGCQVKSGFEWPYCEFKIDISHLNKLNQRIGYDLSQYTRVGIWSKHNHPNQPGTRFEIHNFNPIYSIPGNSETLKYNAVEYYEKYAPSPKWIQLDHFHVPTWWLSRNDLHLKDVLLDYSNVFSMSVVTGSHIKSGLYQFTLEKIEFRGPYFNSKIAYATLIALWVIAALLFLYSRYTSANNLLLQATIQKQEWENKAIKDPLTGSLNRVGAHKVFAQCLNHCNIGNSFSIIFMDIDHFKKVNDQFGHLTGDKILKYFADVIQNNTRDHDVLTRWGGEEFILICPDTNLNAATKLAEKLRLKISKTNWPGIDSLTSSFGVAQYHDEQLNELLERADKALYEAKDHGRNCVVVSEK